MAIRNGARTNYFLVKGVDQFIEEDVEKNKQHKTD
jgi:hypothetical protein